MNAKIGVANAIPVRIAIGRHQTAATDRKPPKRAATPMKIVVPGQVGRHRQEVPTQDVAHGQRGREHGVVAHVPLDVAQHLVGRLPHRHPHRLGRDDRGDDELEIGQAVDSPDPVVDQRPQPDPHRQQEDSGERNRPMMLPRQVRR